MQKIAKKTCYIIEGILNNNLFKEEQNYEER